MKVRPERPRLSSQIHLMLLHQPRKQLLISQRTDEVSARCLAGSYQPLCLFRLTRERVQPGLTKGCPSIVTWSLGCWAGTGTHLGTLMALQATKTRNLFLKAPIGQRPAGSTSENTPSQVARPSWHEVRDAKAVGDLNASSSSLGRWQGTTRAGTYAPLDPGAPLIKMSFPQSLQNNTFYILMK